MPPSVELFRNKTEGLFLQEHFRQRTQKHWFGIVQFLPFFHGQAKFSESVFRRGFWASTRELKKNNPLNQVKHRNLALEFIKLNSTVSDTLPRSIFVKFPWLLDLEHQVTSIDVFHYKEEPVLREKELVTLALLRVHFNSETILIQAQKILLSCHRSSPFVSSLFRILCKPRFSTAQLYVIENT